MDDHQVLPDGETIAQTRSQFIGEVKGLKELSRLLEARENELREAIKLAEQKEQEERESKQHE